MAASNDKTASLFVTKEKFLAAARETSLQDATAEALWQKLADASSQRIIAGATAPRS